MRVGRDSYSFYNNYRFHLIVVVNSIIVYFLCFKPNSRMICEIINIVHSRGMFFLCLNLYIVLHVSDQWNWIKKLLKNKSVCEWVCVSVYSVCVWVCIVYVCVCVYRMSSGEVDTAVRASRVNQVCGCIKHTTNPLVHGNQYQTTCVQWQINSSLDRSSNFGWKDFPWPNRNAWQVTCNTPTICSTSHSLTPKETACCKVILVKANHEFRLMWESSGHAGPRMFLGIQTMLLVHDSEQNVFGTNNNSLVFWQCTKQICRPTM